MEEKKIILNHKSTGVDWSKTDSFCKMSPLFRSFPLQVGPNCHGSQGGTFFTLDLLKKIKEEEKWRPTGGRDNVKSSWPLANVTGWLETFRTSATRRRAAEFCCHLVESVRHLCVLCWRVLMSRSWQAAVWRQRERPVQRDALQEGHRWLQAPGQRKQVKQEKTLQSSSYLLKFLKFFDFFFFLLSDEAAKPESMLLSPTNPPPPTN